MQAQTNDLDRGGTITAIGSTIVVIGVITYFLQMASVDVASWLGDNWSVALVAFGGVLLVVGLLRGSTGGGSDKAA